MTIDNGGQAFARPYSKDDWLEEHNYAQDGMTLRDYLATNAMLGAIITQGTAMTSSNYGDLSEAAYAIADAMITERNKS